VVSKYPLIAIVIGLILYLVIFMILRKTKIGTIVRAGVENPEMVQVMGHNIYRYFTGVFAAGLPLPPLVVNVGYLRQIDSPRHGRRSHCFRLDRGHHRRPWKYDWFCGGGPDVGLSYNYVAYLVPKAALGITMLLLIIILSIRPTGLFPEGPDLNKENLNPVQLFRLEEKEARFRSPSSFLESFFSLSLSSLPFCSVLLRCWMS